MKSMQHKRAGNGLLGLCYISGFILMTWQEVIAQVAGDSLFNSLAIHEIQINFSQPGYWNLLTNNKNFDDNNDTSTYIPAQVIIDGTILDSVGIQFKGNSSYYNYPGNKKPFTLSFDEYDTLQKYDGLKSVNLNNLYQDPSFMREKLFLDFLNSKGLYAPRANYARLYINSAYWGLYYVSERVNKTFCKSRFGNNNGNLFKGDGDGAACANLEYHGVMSPYFSCYTLKTNEDVNDWTGLVNLTYNINMTSDAEFYDSLNMVLNTSSFIGAWAACNMFVDFDAYAFRFVHNYYLYYNSFTGKFEWITWDVSTAFGMDVPGTVPSIENKSILYIEPPATERPLANRMLKDSLFKLQYLDFICDFLVQFNPAYYDSVIDSIYYLIKNDVYADTLKMFSSSDFDNNISSDITVNSITYPGLKSFIQNRSNNIQNELNDLSVNCGSPLSVTQTRSNELKIYPNPGTSGMHIEFVLNETEVITLSLIDLTGREIYRIRQLFFAGRNQIRPDSGIIFSPGIYIVKFDAEKQFITRKAIIIK